MVHTRTSVTRRTLAIILAVACTIAFTPALAYTQAANAAAFTITPAKATVYVGSAKVIKANKKVQWSTSNSKIASISKTKGKKTVVTAIRPGKAVIQATYGKQLKKVKITVKNAAAVTALTSVSVNNFSTGVNTKIQTGDILKAQVKPAGATVKYQWYLLSGTTQTAISGADENVYKVDGALAAGRHIIVKATGTGSYSGTVTSAATVAVTQKIVSEVTVSGMSGRTSAENDTPVVGDTLTADVNGASVTYQWNANGTAISKATSASYTLTSAEAGKIITCTVTGTKGYAGTVTSPAARAVKNGISIFIRNSDTAALGDTLTAVVEPSAASGDVTYQWFKNGTALTGSTSASYTPSAAGTYKVTATVKSGVTKYSAREASASVNIGRKITSASLTGSAGSVYAANDTLTVTAWNSGTKLTYGTANDYTVQWYRNGSAIAGETGNTYTLQTSDAGASVYAVITGVRTYSGNVTTNTISGITAPVKSVAILIDGKAVVGKAAIGSTLSASVTPADASNSVSYQWYENGTPINGATSGSYKVTSSNAGHKITVKVTASGYFTGSQTSAEVTAASV